MRIALALGRPVEGLRLRIVSLVIAREIGHDDLQGDLDAIAWLAANAGIGDGELTRMMYEIEQAHRADGGRGLIREASPEGS